MALLSLSPRLGLLAFLLLHGLASLLLGAATRSSSLPRCFTPVVAAWVLLMPVVGVLSLVLLALALRLIPPPGGDLLDEFREHVEPEADLSDSPRMAQLPLLDHLHVQPLVDLLESPDIEIRRAVLEAMARRGSAPLVACIQKCVNDPRPEIYQLAVAKLSHLQESHSQQISQARAAYQRQPGAASGYTLAEAYNHYIESGLVEPAIRPVYWEQLARLYAEILEYNPRDLKARLHKVRISLSLAAHSPREDVRQLAAKLVKEEAQMCLQLDPGNHQALLCLTELAYYQRDWRSLHEQIQHLAPLANSPSLDIEERRRIEWLTHARSK